MAQFGEKAVIYRSTWAETLNDSSILPHDVETLCFPACLTAPSRTSNKCDPVCRGAEKRQAR